MATHDHALEKQEWPITEHPKDEEMRRMELPLMDLHLLLLDADSNKPVLPQGLPVSSFSAVSACSEDDQPEHLFSDTGDPNDLRRQGWGVIAPADEGGELVERIGPLLALRAREQGIEPSQVRRYFIKERAGDWSQWVRAHLPCTDTRRPRYLLILGDLNRVPLDLQKKLADYNYFPGRLAFDDPAHYARYARKVIHWEVRPGARPRPRVVMLTARTGECDAPDIGYERLMKPASKLADDLRSQGDEEFQFHIEHPLDGIASSSLEDVLEQVRRPDAPTLLWTMSHGLGRKKFDSKMTALNGTTVWGQPASRAWLTAQFAASGNFLPGGFWFCIACYGAATPDSSDYWHWLKNLEDAGAEWPGVFRVDEVFEDIPRSGFVAAVPKAALSNPQGPLAILGHADLAWTYSMTDVVGTGVDPRMRFLRVASMLTDPRVRFRAGPVFSHFRRVHEIDASLCAMINQEEKSRRLGAFSRMNRIAYGTLWMHRQDLANYILLGDPAARLPTSQL